MRAGTGYSLYEACVLQNATVRRSTDMLRALFDRYGSQARISGTSNWATEPRPSIGWPGNSRDKK